MSKLLVFTCLGVMAVGSAVAQNSSLPDGPGKDVVLKMCTVCHSTDEFTSRRATPDEWNSTVQLMVSRGAEGSDQDIAAVIKYLSTNFGPPPTQQPAAPATPVPTKPVIPAPAAPPTSHLNINTAGPHVLLASLTLTPRERHSR